MCRAKATASAQIFSRSSGSRFGAGRELDHLLVAALHRAVALVRGGSRHRWRRRGSAPRCDAGSRPPAPGRPSGRRRRPPPRAMRPRSAALELARRSSTRRMPRPPPPATAFTNTGNVIDSRRATSASTSDDGSDGRQRRQTRPLGRPRSRAALLPVSSRTPPSGPTNVMPASRAAPPPARGSPRGSRSRGRSRPRRHARGRADDLVDVEVRPHRVPVLPDLVGLVGLEPVLRVPILVREDRDGRDAQLGGGAERADGDLATVGDQDLGEHAANLGEEHRPGHGNAVPPAEPPAEDFDSHRRGLLVTPPRTSTPAAEDFGSPRRGLSGSVPELRATVRPRRTAARS